MRPDPSIDGEKPPPDSSEEFRIVAKTRGVLMRHLPVALLCAALMALAPPFPARAGYANPHGVAVIIGNRAYRNERVPEVAYAHRDAEAFRRFVLDVLGFDPGNVIDLRDATQSQMEDAFGNERSHEGRVWRYLHPRHGSDVVVFYSGHGVPGLDDGRGYLLPVDADPDSAKINGYPLDVLYSNLGKLEAAKSVRLYLDACFSGESDRGMLIRSASPVYVQASLPAVGADKLTVLAAASGKEVASWDEEAEHGLFTHHLLDALYGAGDADGDGQVTAAEAKTYLDDTMTIAARREFGRHQNASLNGVAGMVLARVEAGGAFPPRPALEAGNDDRGPGPVDPGSSVARDKYLLGLDKAFESGDHPKMLEFIGMLEGLGGPIPASVEYYRGEAEFHTDRSGKAVRSLRRYIEREGREGQHYRRSLELLLLLDARDDEAYARAHSTGTATAFGEYLSSFPDGRHHADAARRHESALRAEAAAVRAERERREAERRRADDDAFARAKRLNTPSSYQAYLDRGGRHESEARTLRDQRSREEAAAREAERRRQAEARRRADDEAFARAKRLNTSSSYQAYLDRGGRHESEARVLRDQRRREEAAAREAERRRQAEARRRADDEAFARAKRLNTPSSYQAYLDRGGRHESEARTLRDQRRREEAAAREAERRRQAEARRRADDEAAARARRSDTVAGYEAYLSSYPQGRHAEEVQGLLARALSRKWSSGTKFRDCPDCPEMVVIPAGSYLMGSPRSERSRRDNEGPLHRVTIGAPFGAGVYEVTRGEWSRFLEESGSSSDTQCTETRTRTLWYANNRRVTRELRRSWRKPGFKQGDTHPVVCVTWQDAKEYVRWLSGKTGKHYRLLSEPEWEFAARGGTTGPFHFGSTISTKQANYNGKYRYGSGRKGRNRKRTTSVGSFPPNAFGLHDVHGNVWEWVEDCWHESYEGAPVDGDARTSGKDCRSHATRGGSWGSRPEYLRSAMRLSSSYADTRLGFRVARDLD